MIIGLTGYAQSGKDTVAKILVENYGFIRVAFADRIRDLVFEMNPMIDSIAGEPRFLKDFVTRYGWDEAKKNPHIRRILQTTGVGARKVFGEDFWIEQGMRQVDDTNRYVFTDVRFTNEAEAIKIFEGAQVWRIKRLGVAAVNGHVSEHEMDGYPVDQIFTNNTTIEDLELMVKTRMSSLI
jgi:hypothetical protein